MNFSDPDKQRAIAMWGLALCLTAAAAGWMFMRFGMAWSVADLPESSSIDYIVPASVSGLALPGATPALSGSDRRASGRTAPAPSSGQAPSAATVRFDDSATGRPSQILKLGLGGEVEIIRP